MHPITQILVTLVALEFFFIMYLETCATTSKRTAKVFNMDKEELARPSVSLLFKNQGVYNGLVGVALLLGTFAFPSKQTVVFLLGFIVLVALYAGITSRPSLFFKQGILAVLALISMLL